MATIASQTMPSDTLLEGAFHVRRSWEQTRHCVGSDVSRTGSGITRHTASAGQGHAGPAGQGHAGQGQRHGDAAADQGNTADLLVQT